jgi:hypothetical protein
VVQTLVEFKDSYFADPDPAHWTVNVLEELMIEVLPRKVTAPDEWFAAVAPTTRAYLQFLIDRDRMAPGSDPVRALLAAVDQIGDRVLAASRDPRNFGMAKAILTRVGFDPSLPGPARAALEAFNALPDPERASLVDPTLLGPGLGDALSRPGLDESDDVYGRCLPMLWLPPAAELAGDVRAAHLVEDLLRLTAWNGPGYKVTRRDVLPLADARRACADLGLPLPPGKVRSAEHLHALHRLWSLALDCDLLQIAGGAAVRGEAAELLADPDADPDEVVSWWVGLLDACLVEGLDLVDGSDEDEDFEENVEDDVVEAVEDALPPVLLELYSAGRVPLQALDKTIEETVHEILDSLFVATDLSEGQVHAQALHRWRAHVDQLVDLGAATIDDGELDLTPLGRAGVRAIALEDGGRAPLIDDPATLDATTLLRALPPLGDSVGTPLLAAWSAARPPAQAVDQILDAARGGPASTRMTAITVLKDLYADHLHEAGRARLQALRDDPVLAAYAHVLLTEPGQPVHLPPHLQQWTALEAVALAVEGGAFDEHDPTYDADALTILWQIVDQDADLDTAATSPHPQLGDILNAIAAHHPKGRARKAAKKALFNTRNQRP